MNLQDRRYGFRAQIEGAMREFCRRAMLVGVATSISLLLPENEPKKHVHRTVCIWYTYGNTYQVT